MPNSCHLVVATKPYEWKCTDIPQLPIDAEIDDMNQDEDLIDPDDRQPTSHLDRHVQPTGELYDSDEEDETRRRNQTSHRELDRESSSSNGSRPARKFGMGVGIMTAPGPTSTHGAGPSGHMTTASLGISAMDVDSAAVSRRVTPEQNGDEPMISDSRNGR